MKISLPFGDSSIVATIQEEHLLTMLEPLLAPPPSAGATLIREALHRPKGTRRLAELVTPGHKVAVVVSDITRPCPTELLLPPVLDELKEGGVQERDVTIVFALGSHRPHTVPEQQRLVGEEAYCHFRCVDSNPCNVVSVGRTSRGTDVEVFRPVAEADIRICLGNIEFHYIAGYSGGAKTLVPGVCSERTIQQNHAWMIHPEAHAGQLVGNPVREDLEEAAALVGIDFILNVILNETGRIIVAVAGEAQVAHREGCHILDGFGRISIPYQGDIVVASAGGYPKDLNLYQAQKALDNAALVVRDGGTIILVAECREGLGHDVFARWMLEAKSPQSILERIRQHFVLGGHKAAAIAKVLQRAQIYIVSALPDDLVRSLGLHPFSTVDSALTTAFTELGHEAQMIVMPCARSVLPCVDTA